MLIRYREWEEELGIVLCGVEDEHGSESVLIPGVVVYHKRKVWGRSRLHCCFIVKREHGIGVSLRA